MPINQIVQELQDSGQLPLGCRYAALGVLEAGAGPADGVGDGDQGLLLADDVPFEAIQFQFGLDESAVIRFMKQSLKAGSFRLWRHRVEGRGAKHQRRLASR